MSLIPSRPSRNHHYARWLSLLCSNSCPQFGASTRASLVAQTVKNLSAMQETQVWSLGWEDPLQTGIATHSSILAWRIPWTEEPGWPQCMGSQRVRHNWVTISLSLSLSHTHTHTHTHNVWRPAGNMGWFFVRSHTHRAVGWSSYFCVISSHQEQYTREKPQQDPHKELTRVTEARTPVSDFVLMLWVRPTTLCFMMAAVEQIRWYFVKQSHTQLLTCNWTQLH